MVYLFLPLSVFWSRIRRVSWVRRMDYLWVLGDVTKFVVVVSPFFFLIGRVLRHRRLFLSLYCPYITVDYVVVRLSHMVYPDRSCSSSSSLSTTVATLYHHHDSLRDADLSPLPLWFPRCVNHILLWLHPSQSRRQCRPLSSSTSSTPTTIGALTHASSLFFYTLQLSRRPSLLVTLDTDVWLGSST